jgi:hypothetical protein
VSVRVEKHKAAKKTATASGNARVHVGLGEGGRAEADVEMQRVGWAVLLAVKGTHTP